MSVEPRVFADTPELAQECEQAARTLGLETRTEVVDDPLHEAAGAISRGDRCLVACADEVPVLGVVALARAASAVSADVVVAIVGRDAPLADARAIASDLGLVAVGEPTELAAAAALLGAGAERPWNASVRALPAADRARLAGTLGAAERPSGKLTREEDGVLAWSAGANGRPVRVGRARDLAAALAALRASAVAPASASAEQPPGRVDPRAVLDVIFGPPRRLSDPASKAALRPYGVPVPVEELCASPSRAAAEATRIGFPVRIALASPDLRVWDHPELAIDDVDNAARVRDVFRQITSLGRARAPLARLLGVTVTATTPARALLQVHIAPLDGDLVLARVGFADGHGRASRDETVLVLPAPAERIALGLARLRGASMLVEADTWPDGLEPLADVLSVLAAFQRDRRLEVESVEVNPLALLVGAGAEVREACVTVGDAFLRDLGAPAPSQPP